MNLKAKTGTFKLFFAQKRPFGVRSKVFNHQKFLTPAKNYVLIKFLPLGLKSKIFFLVLLFFTTSLFRSNK